MVRAGSMAGVGMISTTDVATIGSTDAGDGSAVGVGVTMLVTVSSRVSIKVCPSENDVVL